MSDVKSGDIYAAMARVMAEVGAVTKAKKNVQQGYSFRGVDDVVAHCQDVMAKHGVICVPFVVEREREVMATKSGGSMASVRLLVDHTFYAKDGSSVVARTLGEAMDSGDKASNKSMSAALKYALTEALLIPTYEVDRDTEEASPELAPAKAKAAAPKTKAADPDREKATLLALFVTTGVEADLLKLWARVKAFAEGSADRIELETAFVKRRRELQEMAKAVAA